MPKIKRSNSFTESDDGVILHYAEKNTTKLDRKRVTIDWGGFDYDIKRAVFSSGREYFQDELHNRARNLIKKNNKPKKAVISLLTDDEDDNNNHHDKYCQPNRLNNNSTLLAYKITSQTARVKEDDEDETKKNNNNNNSNKENKNGLDSFDFNLSDIDSDSVFAKPKKPKSRPKDCNSSSVPRISTKRRSTRIHKKDENNLATNPPKRLKREDQSPPNENNYPNKSMTVFNEFLKMKSKMKYCMELNLKERELAFLLSSSMKEKEDIWEHIKQKATETLRTFIATKEKIPLFEMDRIKHLVRKSRIKSFETLIKEFNKYLNSTQRSSIDYDNGIKSIKDLSRSILSEFHTYRNTIDSEDTKIDEQIKRATDERKQKIQNLLESFLE